MTPFLVELYKMAQTPPQDPQPNRNTPAPKKKELGKAPQGAKGSPAWNDQMQPKQSSGAEMLYTQYCDVMNQLYGG